MSQKYDAAASRDYLPERLPRTLKREVEGVTRFGGLSTPFGGGIAVTDGVNLSPRKAPLVATRLPRSLLVFSRGEGKPHGITRFDGVLIFARGSELFSTADGLTVHSLGTVSDTDKSFCVFGGRLYIYPDRLYMESGGTMPKPMELDTGVMEQVKISGNTVTLPTGYAWEELGFEVGDGLRMINADDVTPAPEGTFRILQLHARTATLANTFTSAYESAVRFRREIPALEKCCVCGDRVYGILGREIYVSGAGSATDFYSRRAGDGKHPVILKSETDGDFTALTSWQGYGVFFKAGRVCKLLGTRSDSLILQDNAGAGIPQEMAGSLCEVQGALYYASFGGVYRYRGQEPERVSGWNGETVRSARGGSDREVYCLAAATDAGMRVSLYLPDRGEWYPEDGLEIAFTVAEEGFFFHQDGEGNIWQSSPDGRVAEGGFDEELLQGRVVSSVTLKPDHFGEPDGYRLVGLSIRATGEVGGSLRVLTRCDGGEETLLGELLGGVDDRLWRVPLLPRPCDGMILRLEAEGDWVIHAVWRTYERMGQ